MNEDLNKKYAALLKNINIPRPYHNYFYDNNEIIQKNIEILIPSVDYEYLKKRYSLEDVKKWLDNTTNYMFEMINYYKTIRDIEIQKLLCYDRLKQNTEKLELAHIEELPEDIIQHIYHYLPYETRVDILLEKYPNITSLLHESLSVKKLKSFYLKNIREVLEKNEIQNWTKGISIRTYLPKYNNMMTLPSNIKKGDLIVKILIAVQEFRKVNPINYVVYSHYQKHALNILLNVLYIYNVHNAAIIQKTRVRRVKKE